MQKKVAREPFAAVLRRLADRVAQDRSAEFEHRKARDREARERYLGAKNSKKMAQLMYSHFLLLCGEQTLDGRNKMFVVLPETETVRAAAERVAKRLRKADGFSVELKQDIDTGRDGFASIPVVTFKINWR